MRAHLAGERPGPVPPAARTAFSADTAHAFVSAISAFEIAVKVRKGKLFLPLDPARWFDEAVQFHGLMELPVTGAIAAASAMLPSPARRPL